MLSLATFPLRRQPTDCDAFGGSARHDLGQHDAFVTILERGRDDSSSWSDFPPRPAKFGRARASESHNVRCGDRPGTKAYELNFTDAERHFHVLVVLGGDVPATVEEEAWRILDGLRLDQKVRPDWPASS
jgi:hypothetical protein